MIEVCTVCLAGPTKCACPYYHVPELRVSDGWWRPKVDHNRPNPFDR